MGRVIDFHTHILPGMDDGSRSTEMSSEMLGMEAEQGIECVVLTPHFYARNESPQSFLKRREKSATALKNALQAKESVHLVLGAEVRYFDGISDSECLKELVIEGTNCILVELPVGRWNQRMWQEISGIYPKHKIYPVLAHLDRYVTPLNAYRIFEEVSRLPVKIQVNAGAFTRFGMKNKMLKLLEKGMVHFIGSDCHGNNFRKPNLGTALDIIERRFGSGIIQSINNNEQEIGL